MAGKRGRDELTEADVKGMKVAELKDELKARGLDTSGKKAELAARLMESLADSAPAEAPAAAPSPKKASPKSSPKSSPKMSPKKASPKPSPKSSPKMSPKKAPNKAAPAKVVSGSLHKGQLFAPEFGPDDHELAGRYMMCVGPILAQL